MGQFWSASADIGSTLDEKDLDLEAKTKESWSASWDTENIDIAMGDRGEFVGKDAEIAKDYKKDNKQNSDMNASESDNDGDSSFTLSSMSDEDLTEYCEVCEEVEDPPYKCPRCYMKYCSVTCCQLHKSNGTCFKVENETNNQLVVVKCTSKVPAGAELKLGTYFYPSEFTVPVEKLRKLTVGKTCQRLKRLLHYPHVRDFIKYLDGCDSPKKEIPKLLQNKEFRQFSKCIMEVFEGKPEAESSSGES